ncbi:transaldolase family protein [Halotia wernerae UHCC 0503]|nr:transaldolase family protein [Halotia wernerae UHCC 0503]
MKIFIDSCDIDSIQYWLDLGVGEGITTNPLLIKKQGIIDVDHQLKQIVNMAGGYPVSIQITENQAPDIVVQARHFSGFGKNVVIKIPIINSYGESLLPVINSLSKQGISVNVTACMMATQAIFAAKAGAKYVSLFFGRISDHGGDPVHQINLVRGWIEQAESNSEIIVGSIRDVHAIYNIIPSKPHICTITPDILDKCVHHTMSQKTAIDFEKAGIQ